MPEIKDIMREVNDGQNKQRIVEDKERYVIYQGRVRDVVEKAIVREFRRPETVKELSDRIIPVNLMQKIINKLAAIYSQPAMRSPLDGNESDADLIELYESSFRINQKMKFANRYFKLHKHTALEPYVDRFGVPRMRSLPSQTYTPFSDDSIEPDRITAFVKHIKTDMPDKKEERYQIWTDTDFVIVDGEGNVQFQEMLNLDNPDGVNPYGVIPFTYIADSDDGNLIPIPDDDLVNLQISVNLLLSDLAFASKYQLWSMLAITGAEDQNVTFNPNSVLTLPADATITVIKPDVDIDQGLRQIEAYVSMLLSTKNLSVGDLSLQLDGKAPSSGVAKMLDKAETTEDRKDQQQFFEDGEKEFWDKYAHHILPNWVTTGQLNPEYVGRFTDDFELSIKFADPKPMLGDKDRIELEKMKLDNGFTTLKKALKQIHSDLGNEQVEMLMEEIRAEEKQSVQDRMSAFEPIEETEEDDAES